MNLISFEKESMKMQRYYCIWKYTFRSFYERFALETAQLDAKTNSIQNQQQSSAIQVEEMKRINLADDPWEADLRILEEVRRVVKAQCFFF